MKSKLNLNAFPLLKEMYKGSVEKNFNFLWYKSGPLYIIHILPSTGWVTGQTIPFTIEIHNNSSIKIKYVKVILVEKIIFCTKSPTDSREVSNTLKTYFYNTPVAPYQNRQYQIAIYLDPIYDFKIINRCGLMHADYFIISETNFSGFHNSSIIKTKITVGTVPFIKQDTIQSEQLLEMASTIPETVTLNETIKPKPPLPLYDDIVEKPTKSGSS